MHISTYQLPQDVPAQFCMNKTAVVIDVLRATTTIITALYNGARNVIPVAEVEEAAMITRNYPIRERLLAGEREAVLIDGFDLSNSPVEFTADKVRDKVIIMTTTNGTGAIQATEAAQVLVSGFVNAAATGRYAAAQGRDVALICAGTLGRFSLEDHLAAGAVIKAVREAGVTVEMDDLSLASLCLYMSHRTGETMHELLAHTKHYQRLDELGFAADLDHCLMQDSMPVVAECSDGSVSWIKETTA
jgi:2-phosphosulfolactate phosphatase